MVQPAPRPHEDEGDNDIAERCPAIGSGAPARVGRVSSPPASLSGAVIGKYDQLVDARISLAVVAIAKRG